MAISSSVTWSIGSAEIGSVHETGDGSGRPSTSTSKSLSIRARAGSLVGHFSRKAWMSLMPVAT
jgi:hypothetical protein